MSQMIGSGTAVLWAWALSGILSLAGALTYAELGRRFPQAGGEYVYLREAYGRGPAFLYGWMRFWIASPGSIAAYAVGAAQFLSGALSLDSWPGGKSGFALITIALLSGINCLTVHFGGRIQTFLTSLKVLLITGIVGGAFFYNPNSSHFGESLLGQAPGTGSPLLFSWSAFGMAMISALWAYDGWNNLPMLGGEIHNPQKNIPKAFTLGMILVFVIYSLVNLAYFHALPWATIIEANSSSHPNGLPIATLTAMTFLGTGAIKFLAVAMAVSAWGAMNGSIMSGARVPFAMAKDNLFIPQFAKLSEKTHVPYVAILIQGLWACVLTLSGTFDQLTDQVVFSSWIFYAACTGSVFVFRRRDKKCPPQAIAHEQNSYRTWGYPIVPILFIFASAVLLTNTLIQSLVPSLIGLGLITAGLPVYFWIRKPSL